ncbi:hypothetical protein YC2023_050642 [Brassica napus]
MVKGRATRDAMKAAKRCENREGKGDETKSENYEAYLATGEEAKKGLWGHMTPINFGEKIIYYFPKSKDDKKECIKYTQKNLGHYINSQDVFTSLGNYVNSSSPLLSKSKLHYCYTVKSKLHLLTFLSEDKVKQCVDPKLKGEWSQHKSVAKVLSKHPKYLNNLMIITQFPYVMWAMQLAAVPALYLCGALVHVGPLEDSIQVQPNQVNVGHQSRIQFSIINFDFVEINCVAYGTVAEKLYENWFSSTAKVVVCVLQLWRIEWGEEIHLFFSVMKIDPNLWREKNHHIFRQSPSSEAATISRVDHSIRDHPIRLRDPFMVEPIIRSNPVIYPVQPSDRSGFKNTVRTIKPITIYN